MIKNLTLESMDFRDLNRQQVGTYAEHYVKMALTKHGISVFTAEVDDRGVDFVARTVTNGKVHHYDIQVKSIRYSTSYIFIPEAKFRVAENFILAIVIFDDTGDHPSLYLIPSTSWSKPSPLLTFKDYESRNLKSKNEYGLNLSKRNMELMNLFRLEDIIKTM